MPDVRRENPNALKQLEQRLKQLGDAEVRVGWVKPLTYEKGTSVAYVASIHEFGYPAGGIPARPFMRPTIAKEKNNWSALMLAGAKAVVAGGETIHTVLDKVGFRAAGDIAQTIAGIWQPPLKPATIAARARRRADRSITKSLSKPLVDSGIMIGGISHEVVTK